MARQKEGPTIMDQTTSADSPVVRKTNGGYEYTVKCDQCGAKFTFITAESGGPFDSTCPECGSRYDPVKARRTEAPSPRGKKPPASGSSRRELTGPLPC